MVEAGDNPDNQVVSTRLISGLSVPIDGTTLYHEGVYQPKSSSQEGQFVYDDDVMRIAGGYATGTSDMGEECCVVVQTTAIHTQTPGRTTLVDDEVPDVSTDRLSTPEPSIEHIVPALIIVNL